MFQVFNSNSLNRNQRFIRAVIAGSISSLLFMIGYGIISSVFRIQFSIVFLAIGYGIGWAIRTYGRGVQPKFSILGAVCAVICFMGADMISYFGFGIFTNIAYFFVALRSYLAILFHVDPNSLLSLLFRFAGVYAAYQTSRII